MGRVNNMKYAALLFAAAAVCAGCGDNLAGPAGSSLLRPPGNLTALSLDSAHVALNWAPASDAADTGFAGYVLSWGTTSDTLPKTAVQFSAGPLGRGAAAFSIRSRLKSGQVSDAATITWAPAWRFDASPITITEYNPPQQSGIPGVGAGTGTTNPRAVGITDVNADSTLDFYLWGPSNSPLQLLSASIYTPGWHATLFSTQSTSSPGLDAALQVFPGDDTFTLQTVTVADNTIYYAKIQGNAGEVYYIRVHVNVLAGNYPSRSVEIRISLQKVPGLRFA